MNLWEIFNLLLTEVAMFTVILRKGQANESTTVSSSNSEENATTLKKGFTEHGEGYIVELLDKDEDWIYTGSLITWNKVLTTCTAILSENVKYASFRIDDQDNGWKKNVENFEIDRRCNSSIISNYLRYNVGVLQLENPAEANEVTRFLQYPSLSKQKYLRLTDQVISRRLNCSATFVTKSGWREITLEMMPSNERAHCEAFTGIHEFVCAGAQEMPTETTVLNQGTPVLCGEDAYGILVAPENLDELENPERAGTPTTRTLVLMRLDEFLHLIVHPEPSFDYYS